MRVQMTIPHMHLIQGRVGWIYKCYFLSILTRILVVRVLSITCVWPILSFNLHKINLWIHFAYLHSSLHHWWRTSQQWKCTFAICAGVILKILNNKNTYQQSLSTRDIDINPDLIRQDVVLQKWIPIKPFPTVTQALIYGRHFFYIRPNWGQTSDNGWRGRRMSNKVFVLCQLHIFY